MSICLTGTVTGWFPRMRSHLRSLSLRRKRSRTAKKMQRIESKEEHTMYQKLLNSYGATPRDVHTVPVQPGREPVWFHVSVEDGAVYVESGLFHEPRSRIYGRRKLNPSECDAMLSLYHRRQRGESVAAEASRTTQNQVYWYGIFAELAL